MIRSLLMPIPARRRVQAQAAHPANRPTATTNPSRSRTQPASRPLVVIPDLLDLAHLVVMMKKGKMVMTPRKNPAQILAAIRKNLRKKINKRRT